MDASVTDVDIDDSVEESNDHVNIETYHPYGASAELWSCKSPEVLIVGPAGTGKTRGVLEKILALADKYPRSRHLICRKTRASMTESVLVTFENKVLPTGSPLKDGPARTQRHSYELANGSSIVVGGLDTPERTFSTEYDTATIFEAFEASEIDSQSIQRSLRNYKMPYQQAIYDTNPSFPSHWLHRRAKAGEITWLKSYHRDNPMLFDQSTKDWTPIGVEYIKKRLGSLTGHLRQRLLLGNWVAAEGVVYTEWDASIHIKKSMPAGWETWEKYRSIDFGYTHPFVCLWGAVDNDGRLWIYRQLYHSGRTVRRHAVDIKGHSTNEQYVASISDHDEEDRATLDEADIRTFPGWKSVTPGIEAVRTRLKLAGDGKPRLYVLESSLIEEDSTLRAAGNPTRIEEEFESYIYKPKKDGSISDEEPLKKFDDALDALRYMVAYIDNLNGIIVPIALEGVSIIQPIPL